MKIMSIKNKTQSSIWIHLFLATIYNLHKIVQHYVNIHYNIKLKHLHYQ